MSLEFKRGDKCPCGRSHFRAYEKTKHGLRPKFQSREVFASNKAADLRRQRLKRAERIADRRGLMWAHENRAGEWPQVPDAKYMLVFQDGFCLQVEVSTVPGAVGYHREVCAVVNKRKYSFSEVSIGLGTRELRKHSLGFQLFANTQR